MMVMVMSETVSTASLVAIAELGIDLSVLVACDLDEVVPVHDRSYLVLDALSLLHFLIRCGHDSLVLHFLAGTLSAVV